MLSRIRQILFNLCGILATTIIVSLIGIAITLSQGSLSLKYAHSFMNAITAHFLAFDEVVFEESILVYDSQSGGLFVEGAQISLSKGHTHIVIKDFMVGISAQAFFKSFMFVLETLTAESIVASIVTTDLDEPIDKGDRSTAISYMDFNPSAALDTLRLEFVDKIHLTSIDYVKKINVPNISFVFTEPNNKRVWRTNDSFVSLMRTVEGLDVKFDFSFNTIREKSYIRFNLKQPVGRNGEASLQIKNARSSVIGSFFPAIPVLSIADAPLDGQIVFKTDSNGVFLKGYARTKLAHGDLKIGKKQLTVHHARADAMIDFVERQVVVEKVDFDIEGNRGVFIGVFTFDVDEAGIVSHLDGTIKAERLLLHFSEKNIVNTETLNAEFNLDLVKKNLDISEVSFKAEGGKFQLSGGLDYYNVDIPFYVDGVVRDFSVEGAKRIWPSTFGQNIKKWFNKNMNGGVIPSAQLKINSSIAQLVNWKKGQALPENTIDLTLGFQNTKLYYLKDMPPMENTLGKIHLRENSFELHVEHASVFWLEEERVIVTSARFFEPDFHIRGNNVQIDLTLDGKVNTLVGLFSHPRIGFVQSAFTGAYNVEGQGKVVLNLQMPIVAGVLHEQRRKMIKWIASSTIKDFYIPEGIGGYEVKAPNLNLVYTQDNLAVEGNMLVNGVPMEMSLTEKFVNGKRWHSVMNIEGVFTEHDFASLNIHPLSQRVRGKVPVHFNVERNHDGYIKTNLEANLQNAKVDLVPLIYEKEKGKKGRLVIRTTLLKDKTIENFSLTLKDDKVLLTADGAFKNGKLESLTIPNIKITKEGTAQINLIHGAQGRKLSFTGSYFDVSRFIKIADLGMSGLSLENLLGEDFSIDVQLDRVQANQGVTLKDFNFVTQMQGGLFETASMIGYFEDGTPLKFNLGRVERKERTYSLYVPEVNNLFRAIGVGNNIDKGQLRLVGRLENEANAGEGELYISAFTIKNIPLFAKILTLGSFKGISDTLQNEGLYVENTEIQFRHKRELIEIESLVAHGAALGITLEGIIDNSDNQLYLAGTLVPAYTLNSLLGRIPLIGSLFSGEKGGGLFGLSYRISGQINNPELSVNPLSSFAPGFIRNIFKVRMLKPPKLEIAS